jgi:hypothetical protein
LCSCFCSGYIWDAGLALCEYIANEAVFAKGHWAGRRGIELGSGTGLCGIVAAALDCDIVITDIGGHVALIEPVSALHAPFSAFAFGLPVIVRVRVPVERQAQR